MRRGEKPTLQNAVAEVRRQQGITQEELARAVGVSRQTIIALEKGNYEPSTSLALKIATALAVPVDQVFWLTAAARAEVRAFQRPDANERGQSSFAKKESSDESSGVVSPSA